MPLQALDRVDVRDGFISGIASSPSVDAYGHKVMPGAFDASIKRKGLKGPGGIKLLAYHDMNRPAGVITRLETVGHNLRIEAELNLDVSYVKDLHAILKQNGGLSFSVGFTLEDYELVDRPGDVAMIIKKGDLVEVSVVCFPACVDARMDVVLGGPFAGLAAALGERDAICQRARRAHEQLVELSASWAKPTPEDPLLAAVKRMTRRAEDLRAYYRREAGRGA